MASPLDRVRRSAAGGAALALSAACFYFGTGLRPVWWLTWLAPLPALWFAYRATAGPAAAVAFGARALGGLNVWAFYRVNLEIPGPVAAAFVLLPAAAFVPAVLLSRGLLRRGAAGAAAVAFPAAWVSFEYLTFLLSPHGTAGNLAYSQADCLPLLQLASLSGVWGVSFVVSFAPAALAVLASAGGTPTARLRLAAASLAFLVAVFAYGAWRLRRPGTGQETMTVGLAATDEKGRVFPEARPAATETLRLYAEQVDRLAGRGARVVVFPEKIALVWEVDAAQVDAMFRDAAARSRATVVVGLARAGETLDENVALVFQPDGAPELTYSKHHMVPGFEDPYRPGTDRTVLRGAPAPRGVEICKDLDFPPLSRSYGADGVGLLLVPAWDFDSDRWLHSRMAVVRGVEGGFSVARAAKQGLLTLSDGCGRVVAEARSDDEPFSTLVAAVPVGHEDTVYVRLGDWLAWICLGAVAVGVGALARRPGRPVEPDEVSLPVAAGGVTRSTSAP